MHFFLNYLDFVKVGFPQKMRLKKYDPVKLSISIFIFMVFIQLI